MRRFVMGVLAIGATAIAVMTGSVPARAAGETPLNACATQNPSFTTDDLSGIPAACVVAPGSLLVETLYYQNASRYGGTALAAYPLFRLRVGFAPHLEAVLDAPSQVAESGPRGIGLYPTTRLGYGLSYTFASGARFAAAAGFEMLPPSTRFTIDQTQGQYIAGVTAGYRLLPRTTISLVVTGASSRTVGFERIAPGTVARVAYDATPTTQISTDLGARITARHAVAQSYGDAAVNQRLGRNVTFALGLGTTFNPVSNAKAHYLATGFNLHLK